jgi:N-acetylated-alpha-linked acidic dipeptidase
MRVIPSPLKSGNTVYDDWLDLLHEYKGREKSILAPMGTGSDYTVFFHHLGIPSLDLVFSKRSTVVYPYHSNYDSYHWIDKFGDPGFKKHLAMARLVGVLAVKMAGIPLLSYSATNYADAIDRSIQELGAKEINGLDLNPLTRSQARFFEAALALDRLARGCDISNLLSCPVSRSQTGVSEINRRYRKLEQSFIMKHGQGLPGRTWYRHIVSTLPLNRGISHQLTDTPPRCSHPGFGLDMMESPFLESLKRWTLEMLRRQINGSKRLRTGLRTPLQPPEGSVDTLG